MYRTAMVFNNSTGSDTLASGIGPSTALTGSGAYCSGSSTVIDLNLDNPDLSGVQVGDCIHLPHQVGTSARSFHEITAIDNLSKTVTVSATISTGFSFQSWAIGGKRAFGDSTAGREPFHSANLQTATRGMTFEIEYTGTDYYHSTTVTINQPCAIIGTGSQLPVYHYIGSGYAMSSGTGMSSTHATLIQNIFYKCDDNTARSFMNWNDETLILDGCKFGGTNNVPTVVYCNDFDAAVFATNCEIKCNNGFSMSGGDSFVSVNNCDFAVNNSGIYLNASSVRASITNSSFHSLGATSYGINSANNQRLHVANCLFNGLNQAINTDNSAQVAGVGNVFVDCGTGYDTPGAVDQRHMFSRSYFRNNTTDVDALYDTENHFPQRDTALSNSPFTGTNDNTLSSTTSADDLRNAVAINTTDSSQSEIRPYRCFDASSGGGGGTTNIFVIED